MKIWIAAAARIGAFLVSDAFCWKTNYKVAELRTRISYHAPDRSCSPLTTSLRDANYGRCHRSAA